MTYNTEFENCLIAIARKYAPQLLPADGYRPGDLEQLMPEFVAQLRDQGIVIVIGDKAGHTEDSVAGAARDCVALYRRVYQFLAARLFPFTYAGTETRAVLCDAPDFIVLGLCAPAGPIVDVIDMLVLPFIIQHHTPPLADRDAMRRLAERVPRYLEAAPLDGEIVDEIAHIVEALCTMALRPPAVPARPRRATACDIARV